MSPLKIGGLGGDGQGEAGEKAGNRVGAHEASVGGGGRKGPIKMDC